MISSGSVSFLFISNEFSLPPATKLGQGNIFRSMCQEFCSQGGLPHCMLEYTPLPPKDQRQAPPLQSRLPWSRHCLGAHTPGSTHPWEQILPQHSACWETRATSGRYASYWNAILFNLCSFIENTCLET